MEGSSEMITRVLGDTHGRTNWKAIVQLPWDHLVFLGDYFDTHEQGITAAMQIANFKEIVAFKRDGDPKKVTLLVGNHDFHYVTKLPYERYSGYATEDAKAIIPVLMEALPELTVAVEAQGWLCTHAGVTETWAAYWNEDPAHLVQDINDTWENEPEAFRFYRGDHGGYGDHIEQGPLWVRPNALMDDYGRGKQIVGHTTQKALLNTGEFVFADCLGTSGEHVVITDGIVTAGKA